MNALQWKHFFDGQEEQHGKRLFTLAELANISGQSSKVLNVTLGRLRRAGVLARVTRGLYAAPGSVQPEEALPWVDDHAYLTGAWALFQRGVITQAPRVADCLTDRRPFRKTRVTGAGTLVFHKVAPPIYGPPATGAMATVEQALCDLVWLAMRRGVDMRALYTFRRLHTLRRGELRKQCRRYPPPVAAAVRALCAQR